MKVEEFKEILKWRLQGYKDNPPLLKSEELYYQLMVKYYERVDRAAKERENLLALLHIYTPLELFYAMVSSTLCM
jgi:predicted Rossmann-fold nucleotide-binding protein